MMKMAVFVISVSPVTLFMILPTEEAGIWKISSPFRYYLA